MRSGPDLQALDRIKRELAERFPGWAIWYVPTTNCGVTWCARPNPLINSPTPERLAFDIYAAQASATWHLHPADNTA